MTDRQTKILEMVNRQKKVKVTELSEILGVSQVTIRKDLDALESMDILTREHGYAVIKNMSDIGNRLAVCYDVKLKIAKAAAEFVSDGETILIESGSSCALLVEELARTKHDITVITNSAFIARFIRQSGGGISRVVLLGGEYQKESEVMVGPLVKICVSEFYVDKLFMGTYCFIPNVGFTCGDMMRAEAMKSMAASARKSIILTDSSKFNELGVVLQSKLADVDMVVTDSKIPADAKAILEKNEIKVETIE
jgi:DeoR/GlpR family transcriptional regulator of sugar metabolism